MKEQENQVHICKSVFKNGSDTISKSRFTKAWIDLINYLEKSKLSAGKI